MGLPVFARLGFLLLNTGPSKTWPLYHYNNIFSLWDANRWPFSRTLLGRGHHHQPLNKRATRLAAPTPRRSSPCFFGTSRFTTIFCSQGMPSSSLSILYCLCKHTTLVHTHTSLPMFLTNGNDAYVGCCWVYVFFMSESAPRLCMPNGQQCPCLSSPRHPLAAPSRCLRSSLAGQTRHRFSERGSRLFFSPHQCFCPQKNKPASWARQQPVRVQQ